MKHKKLVISLLFFTLASYSLRLLSYQQSSFANGWDAYFYLVQVQAWTAEGEMHSPEANFIYPFLYVINLLFNDLEIAYKHMAALLSSGLVAVVLIYVFVKNKLQWASLFLLGALLLYSPHLTYFAAQYPKNLLGIILFVLFLISIEKRYWKSAFLFLVLNAFGHRMTFALAIIVSCIYLVYFFYKKRKVVLHNWKMSLVALMSVLALPMFFPRLLSLADIERLELYSTIRFQMPLYSFWSTFGEERLSLFWQVELILLSLIVVQYCYRFFIQNNKLEKIPLLVVLMILFYPFGQWSYTGVNYRFFLVFYLIAFLTFSLGFEIIKEKKQWIAGAFFLVVSFFSWTSYRPFLHDPPYSIYNKISLRTETLLEKEEVDLVVMHNALAAYFTYATKYEAMPWLPDNENDINSVWRVAYILPIDMKVIPSYKFKKVGVNYFLLKEADWMLFRDILINENRESLQGNPYKWLNPLRKRPDFLRE